MSLTGLLGDGVDLGLEVHAGFGSLDDLLELLGGDLAAELHRDLGVHWDNLLFVDVVAVFTDLFNYQDHLLLVDWLEGFGLDCVLGVQDCDH